MSALITGSHDNTPFFQMIQDHTAIIATIWAGALLLLNAIFAGASANAYAQVEHDAAPVSSRGYISVGEPAYAMAAPTPLHLPPEEARHIEPVFAKEEAAISRAEDVAPAAASEIVAEPEAVEPNALHKEEAEKAEDLHIADAPAQEEAKLEEVKAPMLEESVKAEAAAASPDAESLVATEETEAATVALPEEEPLAEHKDTLPATDPLSHAAPAEPDPSGEPAATPLPSFVKAQPSPKHESSEAA